MAESKAKTIMIVILSIVIIIVLASFLSKLKGSNNLSVENDYVEAPGASAEEPITLSNSEIMMKQGSTQLVGIGVYNPTGENVNVAPVISCDDGSITGISAPISISPKNNILTSINIKTTKKTSKDIHVCTISINGLTAKSVDLVIRII